MVENELRDFRLGGAELPADRKPRFKELVRAEAQVSTRFAENVLDAISAFALYVDDAKALAGVPDDAVQMFAEAAAAEGRAGYKVSLQYPSYCRNRRLRRRPALRAAAVSRVRSPGPSEFGKPEWNNGS